MNVLHGMVAGLARVLNIKIESTDAICHVCSRPITEAQSMVITVIGKSSMVRHEHCQKTPRKVAVLQPTDWRD